METVRIGWSSANNSNDLAYEQNHRLYRGAHLVAHKRLKVFGVLPLLIPLLSLYIVDLVFNFLGHVANVNGDG